MSHSVTVQSACSDISWQSHHLLYPHNATFCALFHFVVAWSSPQGPPSPIATFQRLPPVTFPAVSEWPPCPCSTPARLQLCSCIGVVDLFFFAVPPSCLPPPHAPSRVHRGRPALHFRTVAVVVVVVASVALHPCIDAWLFRQPCLGAGGEKAERNRSQSRVVCLLVGKGTETIPNIFL